MKKIVLALAALTALGTIVAYSYTCRTNCQWIGNFYQCTERCTEW